MEEAKVKKSMTVNFKQYLKLMEDAHFTTTMTNDPLPGQIGMYFKTDKKRYITGVLRVFFKPTAEEVADELREILE